MSTEHFSANEVAQALDDPQIWNECREFLHRYNILRDPTALELWFFYVDKVRGTRHSIVRDQGNLWEGQ